jgi:hypothetical protein
MKNSVWIETQTTGRNTREQTVQSRIGILIWLAIIDWAILIIRWITNIG